MIAWRTPIVRQAETTADNGGKDHATGSQPESAAPICEQSATASSTRPRSFAGTIMQLFQQAKKVFTLPAKERRRRYRDSFSEAGQYVMRWIRRPETAAPDAERPWLSDTLDWLQIWTEEPATAPDLDHDPMRPSSFDPSADFSPDL